MLWKKSGNIFHAVENLPDLFHTAALRSPFCPPFGAPSVVQPSINGPALSSSIYMERDATGTTVRLGRDAPDS
ncbi:MAG: hypothetical protein GX548_07355 [Lentisphaerae bacterium]|nr:hypothetical protein [Lentisphaerota bacterium]